MSPLQRLAQVSQPCDALLDGVQRLAPEQLHVSLGGRNALGGLRCPAKVQPRVAALLGSVGALGQGRALHPKEVAPEGDVFPAPQQANEMDELLGPSVALGLVTLLVAVGSQLVDAADDVDQHSAFADLVEGGHGTGERRRAPKARDGAAIKGWKVDVRAARAAATAKVSGRPQPVPINAPAQP